MYHIKNDKRCERSAAKIGEALRALLAEKPLKEITVTDVQKMSRTGRATFYRLFDTVDDVLVYIAEVEFMDLMALYKDMSWSEFTKHIINSILSESRGLINVASSGKTHLLSKALRSKLTEEAASSSVEFDNKSKYMIAMFVGGCLSLVNAWDESGREEPIEELVRLMQQAFNYNNIEATMRRPVKG